MVIVVHLHADFVTRLAQWLDTAGPIKVLEARRGMRAESGVAYLAPADEGLLLDREGFFSLKADCAPLELGDHMLLSLAKAHGDAAAGLVLSGMGEDGARGLKAIFEAGGKTAVQTPSSAVLASMPKQAAPWAQVQLPVVRIPRWARSLF
jgi:two-component system chemotaxis response regulator CheB